MHPYADKCAPLFGTAALAGRRDTASASGSGSILAGGGAQAAALARLHALVGSSVARL
jgi:hypothetical protein